MYHNLNHIDVENRLDSLKSSIKVILGEEINATEAAGKGSKPGAKCSHTLYNIEIRHIYTSPVFTIRQKSSFNFHI